MRYNRLIAEWLAAGRYTPTTTALTVVELCARYREHAREYYRTPDGKEAKSIVRIKLAIRDLRNMYGDVLADEFGPLKLQALRETWINNGMCRTRVFASKCPATRPGSLC